MQLTFPDKIQNFGISSVGQVEKILKYKIFDESVEYFN